MEIPLLHDIIVVFGLAVIVLFLCHRLRVPAVVGFLLTGIIIGPFGAGLIHDLDNVATLAELGIVLLLFTIGIEFSLKMLLEIRRAVLLGGSLQVAATFLATVFIARRFGLDVERSVFLGFLVALSSSAIVLKLLQEKADVDSPHGRTTLGILIFQDIIVVPMMLLTPLLAGGGGEFGESLLILTAKGVGIIALIIAGAKWIVPNVLYQIARTRSQELFLIAIVLLCFGIAWLTSMAGLSLALGAFLAGLIISESEYSHRALGNVLPFRDVFTIFFFVSIGMMLDIGFFLQHPLSLLALAVAIYFFKALIAGIVTVALGRPLRTGIIVGLGLGQIGEFSFVLSRVGVTSGLIDDAFNQGFLAVAILGMAATPFIIAAAPRIADLLLRLPLPRRLVAGRNPVTASGTLESTDHLIIIGYGTNGRNVARAARKAGIAYVIIEMNPDTVRRKHAQGEVIFYGDATQQAALHAANLAAARIVVVAINDPAATQRVTGLVHRLNPDAHLIVRTRYVQEVPGLYKLGASDVIPEEYETSMEIFTRVLAKYLVPRDDIERFLAEIRADGYTMFRSLSAPGASLADIRRHLKDIDVSTHRIETSSALVGMTLGGTAMRTRFGVSVVAVMRDEALLPNPGAEMIFRSGDVLYLMGSADAIATAARVLTAPDGTDAQPHTA